MKGSRRYIFSTWSSLSQTVSSKGFPGFFQCFFSWILPVCLRTLKSLLTVSQSPGTFAQTDCFRTKTTPFSRSFFYFEDIKDCLVRKVCRGWMAETSQILGWSEPLRTAAKDVAIIIQVYGQENNTSFNLRVQLLPAGMTSYDPVSGVENAKLSKFHYNPFP